MWQFIPRFEWTSASIPQSGIFPSDIDYRPIKDNSPVNFIVMNREILFGEDKEVGKLVDPKELRDPEVELLFKFSRSGPGGQLIIYKDGRAQYDRFGSGFPVILSIKGIISKI